MPSEDIEALFERVRSWPKDWQQHAVERLEAIEHDLRNPYVLSDEERADVEAGIAAAERGEFATDEEIEALFGRRF